MQFKKSRNFKKLIIASFVSIPFTTLAFVPSISRKIEKQNFSLVQVKNDKSFLANKPTLYQFESDDINFFQNSVPLKYKNINWNLSLPTLVKGLDSFDGKKYFKDYFETLTNEFNCLLYGKNYTFIKTLNAINHLANSMEAEIEKANYYIECYQNVKQKKLDAIDSFKNGDFTNENLKKMSIAKIMELVSHKYNVNPNTLNEFSYDELVGMLVEDDSDEMVEEIEEIDDAIQACELYKLNHQDKLKFLNDMKKELINAFNKFVEEWKSKNEWYKNYDTEKEMKKEMKKDYELNKFFLEKLTLIGKNGSSSLSYFFLTELLNDLFASSFFIDDKPLFTSSFIFK